MQPDSTLGSSLGDSTLRAAALDADLILVGGGLANGLIAWRLHATRPDLRVLLLERGARLGGNHTWSFHESDLTPAQCAWLSPFVEHHWPGHEVVFPERRRQLDGTYASFGSVRFHHVLRATLGDAARTLTEVTEVAARAVTLADGTVLRAQAVIDGRGVPASPHLVLGYQKFLGREVRLAEPHGLTMPVLMDASVPQLDGYRFVYLLPLSADTLLIEDTYYADGDALDAPALRERIAEYARTRGWSIVHTQREEHGVLPIVLGGDVQAFWRDSAGVSRSGLAAGLFHPTTGYSLPDAVALAERIASAPDLESGALFETIRRHATQRWASRGFFRVLNRMLFRSAPPDRRRFVMQRFYGLPAPLIARFYAARLTAWDKLRIVTGKPPVPLLAAAHAALDLSAPAPRGATP